MGYIKVIYTGLLVFPFIAAVITLPYAVYQYNRHGSVSKYRTLIIYFIMYFINAVFRKGKLMPHDKFGGTLFMATKLLE